MIVIGLVGGVACGKSWVAECFRKLGGRVLNGDKLGHETLAIPTVQKKLVNRWGDRVLNESRRLDRGQIAQIVFSKDKKAKEELKFLESVTHPEIERQLVERIEQIRTLGRHPAIILDAAIMIKAGWDRHCDKIIFVETPQDLRLKRAMLRGLTESQFHAREVSQTPLSKKKARADLTIDNSGTTAKNIRSR